MENNKMDAPENNAEQQIPADRLKTQDAGAVASQDVPVKETYEFSDLNDPVGSNQTSNLDFILDIPLEITVELGRTKMMIHDLLKLGQGSVIELGKLAGDTLEILANNRLIAKGDVVVMNDKYGIRLTEVISTVERLEKLK
jgi:flagellar motor switch protein FliN/FliY